MTDFPKLQISLLQPHLIDSLKNYDFQDPGWKFARDQAVKVQLDLESLSPGLKEILSSRIRLFAHQAEVVERVLDDANCRFLLADEVGLGKTIEASVILRVLQKRQRELKTLIIVPRSIAQQWKTELAEKFWLDLPIMYKAGNTFSDMIVPSENIITGEIGQWLLKQSWDLLIVDEAHRLTKQPELYHQVLELSRAAQRCLILSATPIQRRSTEFLQLLRLMDPSHYEGRSENDFKRLVEQRAVISKTVAYLTRGMQPDEFDAIDFTDEMQQIIKAQPQDRTLANLVAQVSDASADRGLQAAQTALSYVSENYRIEQRAIRNRRASVKITLPKRSLNADYSYTPEYFEAETLSALYDYVDACLKAAPDSTLDYSLALLNAGGSSPHALLSLINFRLQRLTRMRGQIRSFEEAELLRGLETVVRNTIETSAFFGDEVRTLEGLADWTQRWKANTDESLQDSDIEQTSHRFVQVLRAISQLVQSNEKVVVFSGWEPTCALLGQILQHHYGSAAIAHIYGNQMKDRMRRVAEIERFQTEPRCLIMLITDEFGSEGHNFQTANSIIHVDLPWTPARLEQRIGRVDRLGRRGVVTSIVPYGRSTLEEDLFRLWADALKLFDQSMSGMEIVLEELQDQISKSVVAHSRNGLALLLPDLQSTAEQLRDQIDEERYFEEAAIDYQNRSVFEEISETFHNGENVSRAILDWARLAGPRYSLPRIHNRIIAFDLASETFLKLREALPIPPEANRVEWHDFQQNGGKCRGTFDRRMALRDTRLFFFAPGTPLVQWIIGDALQSERGRCSANWRVVPELDEDWFGFEFFYKIRQRDFRYIYVSLDGMLTVFPENISGKLQHKDHAQARRWQKAAQFAQTELIPSEWRHSLERAARIADMYLNDETSKQTSAPQTTPGQPHYVLESVCFWMLKAKDSDER